MPPRQHTRRPVGRYGPADLIAIPQSIRDQYNQLDELMRWELGVPSARQFQIDGILYQAMGCDAIVHARTGLGKTAIVSRLHTLPKFKKRISILVSPLLALQSDMVSTFNEKYPVPVPAIAVNSAMDGRELSYVLKAILAGKYQIILISPESLLSLRIRDELLLNPVFKKLVASIVIDEAHCVLVWGSGFRKKYGTLHVVRSYLPKVPILAMSATLTPRVLRDLENKLHMGKSYGFINLGNERPSLSIAIRRCQFPMNSFRDLTFIFNKPGGVYHPLDIPKTFIFIDNKTEAYRAVEVLLSYLPPHLRYLGIIRPYNARHSPKYRLDAMEHFKAGNIRVLVCMDAAGMGCDISGVEISVQWRVTSLSQLLQRWGRAGRGSNPTGALVILFVEPSGFTYNPTVPGTKEADAPRANLGPTKAKKTLKEPLRKGGFHSDVPGAEPELRDDSPYEGTLAMVQTKGCHRKIWTKAFHNEPVPPTVKCCSSPTCNPELLDEIKAAKPPQVPNQPTNKVKKAPRRGEPHLPTRRELVAWRPEIWRRDHSDMTWSASALLNDDLVEYLASIGPIPDYETLQAWFAHRWGWWDRYGRDLATLVIRLQTPHTPRPSKSKTGQKRKAPVPETPSDLTDPSGRLAALPSETPNKAVRRTPKNTDSQPTAPTSARATGSTATRKRASATTRVPQLSPYETLSWSIAGYENQADAGPSNSTS